MATDTDSIKVSVADRRILTAALVSLERELSRDGRDGPIRENLDRLKKALSNRIPGLSAPSHVELHQADYVGLMSLLPASDSWRLCWEPSEGDVDNSYELIAELTRGEDDGRRFVLASNLRGTGRFLELEPSDLAFCRFLEQQMRTVGWNSAQCIHEVVEFPLPWDFLPDENTGDRLESYLNSVCRGLEYCPAIHSTFLDIHSDPELAERGFAGVMTEISGYQNEINDAKQLLDGIVESILSAPKLAR